MLKRGGWVRRNDFWVADNYSLTAWIRKISLTSEETGVVMTVLVADRDTSISKKN